MDETGQPSGAVPDNNNGTGDPRDGTRRPGGWGPPPVSPPVAPPNGSDANGARREPTWSSAGAALEPAMDPLSAAWPGAAGFGHLGYQDVGTPVAVGAAQAMATDPSLTAPATAARPTSAPPAAPVPPPVVSGRATPVAPPPSNGPPAAPPHRPPPMQVPATAYPASAPPYAYQSEFDGPEATAAAQYESWNSRPSAPLPPGHVAFGEATPPRGFPTVVPSERQQALDQYRAPDQAQRQPADAEAGPGTHELPEPAAQNSGRAEILPQRVPAEPDVPALPEPVADEAGSHAEAAELARIAARLKHGTPAPPTREGFDVDAVLAAVREVPGVRDAHLRRNRDGSGVHTLRLDLADGADPAQVSRVVARLLGEKMGLSAALGAPGPLASPAAPGPAGAYPSQPSQLEPPRTYRATAKTLQAAAAAPDTAYQARRRHAAPRGRAVVEPRLPTDDHGLTVAGTPYSGTAYGGTAYSGTAYGGPSPTGAQPSPGPRPAVAADQLNRPLPPPAGGLRVVLDHVQVSTFGLDATVEVRLGLGDRQTIGEANGPAVDGYVLRLCAVSAAAAVDQLLLDESNGASRGRCFVEHAAVVPFGSCEVALAVVLLVCDGWVEQLAGSALVAGDPRQSVVRATLAAVNRRLESLLS